MDEPEVGKPAGWTRRELIKIGMASALGAGCASSVPASGRGKGEGGMATNVPGPVTTVEKHHGKPAFFCDGKPVTKPVFETYVPKEHFFQQFAAADSDIYSFSTNLGHGFEPPTWLGPEEWDFSELDACAHRVLEADPRGLIMPRILLATPDWWVRQNPDELQILADGTKVYSSSANLSRAGRAYPSVASEKWRRDMASGLRRLIAHMQQADYAAHMFGYMVTGLMTEEWYHWSIHTNQLSDYGVHMARAFRQWLRERYRTPEALRAAWNDPAVDFETASVPSQEARQKDRRKTFRDPATDMPVIDYYLFYNDIIPETIDHFAKAAKEETGGKKVVGAFYGYMYEFSGDPEFGHNALGKLMQSPNLDFMMVTASYYHRHLGKGADYMRSPMTSVALHDKLWYHDNDTVSFRFYEMMKGKKEGYDTGTIGNTAANLGVTSTAWETIQQYRRGAGFTLGNGVFESFFDLHGGYFDNPQLMAEIKRLNHVLDESKSFDGSSCAQILLVADETSCSYCTFESQLLEQTLAPLQVQLNKVGAPYDSVLVDDLALLDIRPYKLVLFVNTFHLTDQQRQLIARKVLQPGKTALWCYAPGLFNGSRTDPGAMRLLTGFRLVPSADETQIALRIALTEGGHPLTKALKASCPAVMGTESKLGKLISVENPEATVLGKLPGSEAVTLALKETEDRRSVYALTPLLPAAFYREAARWAGVHLYNDRDDTLYASKSYLTVNADGAGARTIRLPARRDVIDPFTHERLYAGVTEFTRDFADKETLLVRLA